MSALPTAPEAAALTALAGAPAGLRPGELASQVARAGVAPELVRAALFALVDREWIAARAGAIELTGAGARALLDLHAALERALDPSPTTPGMEWCPSVPWLTTVQTHWIEALSLNYAVDPDALRPLVPHPLEPEVFHGTAWVQVLVSRLREMRPQGLPALFGVNFHQVSYRAAVRYRGADGAWRRGGYFVRSETDHPVMRAVGNALIEFRFHDFGHARVGLAREGARLALAVDPLEGAAHGEVRATVVTDRAYPPPAGSAWRSVEALREPLVACYDAFGVDPAGWIYVLTIDREPWRERFADVRGCRAAYFEEGPLGRGASRLDSVLHIPEPCGYRWRPLRRERFGG